MTVPAIEMLGITKVFPRVVANRNVSLTVRPGEVHGLVGENGAGKSTLMKVLYGLHAPDAGEIRVGGIPRSDHSPSAAIRAGIGMVHQHFMLIPTLTVAENVVLGIEPRKHGAFLDLDRAAEQLTELSRRFHLDVDPRARVAELSVGQEQRVEIIKVLYRGAKILILDEPTAVLTPQEVGELFQVIRILKQQGSTIVLITHKLGEVMTVADRVSVMRRGELIGTVDTPRTSPAELARMMVGRDVLLTVDKGPATPREPVLRVTDLEVPRTGGGVPAVQGVSFEVRAGEVFGIAGVEGNGQSELLEALAGLHPIRRGRIELAGQDVTRATPARRFDAGLAHVPEDRHKRGCVLSQSVADNLILGRQRAAEFVRAGVFRNGAAITANAVRRIAEFDVRPIDPDTPMRALSGGNQQKVILAREFSRAPKLLMAAQPTRGVDIGAIEFIHRRIIEARDRGMAVLLVSAELSEILSLSDRIAVLYQGRIMAVLDRAHASEEKLGLLMAGSQA